MPEEMKPFGTLDEIEAVLLNIFVNRNYKIPMYRSGKQCAYLLHAYMQYYGPTIRKAVDIYHSKHTCSESCRAEAEQILANPVNDRDEDKYYSLVSELLFKQEGKTIEESIHEKSKIFLLAHPATASDIGYPLTTEDLLFLYDMSMLLR
jgi:hypothetical protein